MKLKPVVAAALAAAFVLGTTPSVALTPRQVFQSVKWSNAAGDSVKLNRGGGVANRVYTEPIDVQPWDLLIAQKGTNTTEYGSGVRAVFFTAVGDTIVGIDSVAVSVERSVDGGKTWATEGAETSTYTFLTGSAVGAKSFSVPLRLDWDAADTGGSNDADNTSWALWPKIRLRLWFDASAAGYVNGLRCDVGYYHTNQTMGPRALWQNIKWRGGGQSDTLFKLNVAGGQEVATESIDMRLVDLLRPLGSSTSTAQVFGRLILWTAVGDTIVAAAADTLYARVYTSRNGGATWEAQGAALAAVRAKAGTKAVSFPIKVDFDANDGAEGAVSGNRLMRFLFTLDGGAPKVANLRATFAHYPWY